MFGNRDACGDDVNLGFGNREGRHAKPNSRNGECVSTLPTLYTAGESVM